MKKASTRSSMLGKLGAWALAAAMCAAGAAHAQGVIPVPDHDPFYTPPADYLYQPNGTVLASRQINAEYLLPLLSTDVINGIGALSADLVPALQALKSLKVNAYQVLYKSTDGHGNPVADAATILVPQWKWGGAGPRPLVSFQSAEDSVDTRCAPSYVLRTGLLGAGALSVPTFDIAQSLVTLAHGYAIVYPDHEGPHSQWIAGKQSGQATLDGVRAALNYAPAGLSPRTPVGLWGYSGGGGATGWAAILKPTYAPELNVVGAVVGSSSNSDITRLYKKINGRITSGFVVLALVGLDRAYPEAGVGGYLNAAGKTLLAGAQNLCAVEALAKYPLIGPMEQYSIDPAVSLTDSPPGKFLFPTNSLVDQPDTPSSVPILSYHDWNDEVVPVQADDAMAAKWCAAGTPVQVSRTWLPLPPAGALIHGAAAAAFTLPAVNYLANRFNNVTPRNDCSQVAVWDSNRHLLPVVYKPLSTN